MLVGDSESIEGAGSVVTMLGVMIRDVREQTFGQRVRRGREELGLSQRAAAAQANLGEDTWRTAERGYKLRRNANPEDGDYQPERITVLKIAKVLGWAPDKALRWAGYDEPAAEPESSPTDHLDPLRELARLAAELSVSQQWSLVLLVGTIRNPLAPIPGVVPVGSVAVDHYPSDRA